LIKDRLGIDKRKASIVLLGGGGRHFIG
jgi:hypothetical protein